MGSPVFLLQIVHTDDGKVAKIPAGGDLEHDLIELCVKHIVAKGVGFFKTQAQVEKAIRDGIGEAIWSLKDQTRFII